MSELIEKLVEGKNRFKKENPWVEPFWKLFKPIKWGVHITDKGKIIGQYTVYINDDIEVDYTHSTKPGLVFCFDKEYLEGLLDDEELYGKPFKAIARYVLPNLGRGIKVGWKKKPKF